MSAKIQIWTVGVLLTALFGLATWGLFWSNERDEQRWSDPLTTAEQATLELIASAIGSGDAGIRFLDSLSKDAAVYEVAIRLAKNPSNRWASEGQAITLKQEGRFGVGRKDTIAGYEYEVKFNRPMGFVLGYPEDNVRPVSEVAFWVFAGAVIFWLYFGSKVLPVLEEERRAKRKTLPDSNREAA